MKNVFGDERFKLIFFEELNKQPEKHLFELEEFLDISHIDYDQEKLFKKVNSSKSIEMPDSFRKISTQLVKSEIDSLQSIGVEIPENWL